MSGPLVLTRAGAIEAQLWTGDNRIILPGLEANSVDSVVCDPPYHLTAGKKGGSGPASVNLNSPQGRARIGAGFMGQKWDGGDVAMRPETWEKALRVAKPGAYMLAFGGTRTFHRIWCAIEDAGWEIRDTIMWTYGSGAPKSLDISKALDRRAGFDRPVVGYDADRARPNRTGPVYGEKSYDRSDNGATITKAVSELAKEWQGWGTNLKPAFELICVARKPLDGTVAENIERWGVGGLNIDACRIAVGDDAYARNCSGDRGHDGTRDMVDRGATDMRMGGGNAAEGRWPANLIHDGSDEVVSLFPVEAGAFAPVRGTEPSAAALNAYGARDRVPGAYHEDFGGAARFFYCPKADRFDRNEGCENLPRGSLNWSSGDANPGVFQSEGTDRTSPNYHPTVKPVDLMRYLVRLVTPPGGLVLDHFMGSGSTGKAAILEGLRFVGIEGEAGHVAIAEARIRAAQRRVQSTMF